MEMKQLFLSSRKKTRWIITAYGNQTIAVLDSYQLFPNIMWRMIGLDVFGAVYLHPPVDNLGACDTGTFSTCSTLHSDLFLGIITRENLLNNKNSIISTCDLNLTAFLAIFQLHRTMHGWICYLGCLSLHSMSSRLMVSNHTGAACRKGREWMKGCVNMFITQKLVKHILLTIHSCTKHNLYISLCNYFIQLQHSH